jgi:DNA-binding transcriptional MocR family regulator
MVRGVIEGGGLEENVARLVSIYRSKRDAMAAGLDEHLPGAAYALPGGGYFFWVRLPGGMDASALQQNAEGLRVNFRPGIRFSSRGSQRDYVRLCFIFYGSEEIEEGLRRLAQTITLCGHDASR